MSDGHNASADDVQVMPETPEDVAILYSWANLPGAKYRDFSASRREYRAQQRARLAEEQHQAELQSAQALEEAARRELEEAQRALDAAQQAEAEAAADAEAKLRAEEVFRQAEAHARVEQEEAQRRQQSAETLRLRAQAARNEMMAARKRAEEQAARYADFDAQYRQQMESRAEEPPPGQLDDPYYYTGQVDPAYFAATPGVRTSQASRASTERKSYVFPVHPGSDEFDAGTLQSYRSNTPFAPSPAQDYSTLAPMRDLPPMRNLAPMRDLPRNSAPLASGSISRNQIERDRPDEQERFFGRDPYDVSDPDADNAYYSNNEADPPPSATDPFRGYNTAERDLHIRPQPRFVRAEGSPAPPPSAPSQPVSWAVAIAQAAARSHRDAAVDNRARTVRQPRPEESFSASSLQVPADNNPAVPPAWLAYQEEASTDETAAFDPPRPPATPQPQRQAQPWQPAEPRPAVRSQTSPFPSFVPSVSRFPEQATPPPRREPERALPNPPRDAAPVAAVPVAGPAAPDTLQQSRERFASRWFALQGLMDQQGEAEKSETRQASMPAPVVVLFSLSGGVGKTSMAATLGRALSSLGEKVLMADTNTHGLLPYYFGARDLRPGAVRTFTPPTGSLDAPVLMVHYEVDRLQDEPAQARLMENLTERAAGVQRVLVDLSSNSLWLARRLAYASPYLLVPIAPDMNSILTTQTIEGLFADVRDTAGEPVRPYYVLNQFDSALPLHLDVREVLRQSLGDRLLPVTIHRSPAVSEALAEGMTVIDYAPGTPVADDYMRLADWIRSLAAPGAIGFRGARWSER